jgi:hypothetical protein
MAPKGVVKAKIIKNTQDFNRPIVEFTNKDINAIETGT